ncbi:hypothetical protein AX17_000154 [Amanita inopinata Kibby_2008]|nr:hypothetical protein AX17_000154 [Amanita inopinata Kibby_2008]
MATEGLLQWANGVRLTMATDPGRQLFKDQVQTHGFSFIDDYIDNILSNAVQDQLIDLVKTPGRKRIMSKKGKVPSKLKDTVPLSLEGVHRELPNESWNTPDSTYLQPRENMTKSTFMADPSVLRDQIPEQSALGGPLSHNVHRNLAISVAPSNPSSASTSSLCIPDTLHTSRPEINELSIIAEDDENAEKSHLSIASHSTDIVDRQEQQGQRVEEGITSVEADMGLANGQPLQVTTLTSSLDSGNKVSNEKGNDSLDNCSKDPGAIASVTLLQVENSVLAEEFTTNNSDKPHDSIEDGVGEDTNVQARDMTVPLRDADVALPSPGNKPNIASFPPLISSAPLRKSMRVNVEHSTGVSSLDVVTPGAGIGSKRTSWLQKARQAKALEIAGKKTAMSLSSASLLQLPSGPPTNSTKRKSADLSAPDAVEEDEERHHKAAKNAENESAPTNGISAERETIAFHSSHTSPPPMEAPRLDNRPSDEEGMLDRLKKTVSDLGSRTGRGMGKSLGGSAAASALASARAAAEARIAERNMKEEESAAHEVSGEEELISGPQDVFAISPSSAERAVKAEGIVTKEEPEQRSEPSMLVESERKSDRPCPVATPPNALPSTKVDIFIPPPGPVFNKPPIVFVPPSKPHILASPANNLRKDAEAVYSSANLDSLLRPLAPSVDLSRTESALEGVRAAVLDERFSPRVSGTQDTVGTDTQTYSQGPDTCDEYDSSPIDNKFTEGLQWVYEDAKDDSMTWSSLHSQQTDTHSLSRSLSRQEFMQGRNENLEKEVSEHHDSVFPCDQDIDMCQNEKVSQDGAGSGIHDLIADCPIITSSPVDGTRSQSQMSVSSSNSSQSQQLQVGFFGQATKLLSNMMGSGKKGKPEVKKVLQKAAVAAKKQQEEADRKVTRLKEMENRRQLAMQRKADEEKARTMEQEKKLKEDSERRKREREREEHTEKRTVKASVIRKEEDTAKKRKIEIEKTEAKKLLNAPKSIVKSTLKQPSALSFSAAYNSSSNTAGIPAAAAKPVEIKSLKISTPANATSKGKGKLPAKVHIAEEDLPPPSQIVQTQMAARAKAQLRAAKQANEPPPIPSESIELPDINSEYSDSEDEDRQRTFDPPDWAQSPELRHALQQQSTINPDDIFGAIRPLRMEEIFKTRTSRFRARTSSANWGGADRLTAEEEIEYARRMGFK